VFVLFVGYAIKTTQVPEVVRQCVVGVATGANWSRSSIAVIANITGAATSSAKPAQRQSKLADVVKRTCSHLLTYLLLLFLALNW